jgi:hypothetical protein
MYYPNHQFKFIKICYNACHVHLDPFSIFWDLDSRLRGCGARVIDSLFFKSIWKIRKEDTRLI